MTRRPKRPPNVCSAAGCAIEIPRARLMCREHWYQVPRVLRSSIRDAWDGRRIREWSSLCLQARQHVAANPAPSPALFGVAGGSFHPGYAAIQRRMLGEGDEA